jgi:hypothetical protein
MSTTLNRPTTAAEAENRRATHVALRLAQAYIEGLASEDGEKPCIELLPAWDRPGTHTGAQDADHHDLDALAEGVRFLTPGAAVRRALYQLSARGWLRYPACDRTAMYYDILHRLQVASSSVGLINPKVGASSHNVPVQRPASARRDIEWVWAQAWSPSVGRRVLGDVFKAAIADLWQAYPTMEPDFVADQALVEQWGIGRAPWATEPAAAEGATS